MNFMLFYGRTYYPNGGMNDFKGHFESKEACLSYLKEDKDGEFISWGHIFNAHSALQVVKCPTSNMEIKHTDIKG